jgi:hypothetical protein
MDNSVDKPSIAAVSQDSKATDAPQKAPEVVLEASEPAKKKRRTTGNIIYDFGVFGTVAWAGVALLSAVSAHQANFGTHKAFGWWRDFNKNVTDGIERGLGKSILKNAKPETVKGYAKGTTMFLTLGMGGNALMAPIKWLEDNRQKNAARIDHVLGTTPPDPETIAHEPKQTWKSVFSGRLFSWGMSYVAFLAIGPRITDNIQKWFGEKATQGWMKLKPKSDRVKVGQWANVIAFDALFTIITASLTYGLSRYVAKNDEKTTFADDLYMANSSAPRALIPVFEEDPPKSFASKVKATPKSAPAATSSFTEKVSGESATEHART